MVAELGGEVEGDERNVQSEAGALESVLRGGPDGDDVVYGEEGLQAVGEGGGVGVGESGSAEDIGDLGQ